MARDKRPASSNLARMNETWIVPVARLRTWILPEGEAPFRPYVALVISIESGALRASDIYPQAPAASALVGLIRQAIREPLENSGEPGFPARVLVAESEMAKQLSKLLKKARLEIEIAASPMPPALDEFVRKLEEEMRGGPEPPGHLSVQDVTPDLVGGFFAAAADWYRSAPWVYLDNYQVLSLQHPAERGPRFATVLGQGGHEYGLTVFRTWNDVQTFYASGHNPEALARTTGASFLSFDSIALVPFQDLEAIEAHGWAVADPNAYPVLFRVSGEGELQRPDKTELEWFEAALRAIPILVGRLTPDDKGDYAPIQGQVTVAVSGGQVQVAFRYPAGALDREQEVVRAAWMEEEEEDDDDLFDDGDEFLSEGHDLDEDEDDLWEGSEPSLKDPRFPRATEQALAEILKQSGTETGNRDPDLERAQDLIYQAQEEPERERRIELAKEALRISQDCADAYVLLAEEEAETLGRVLEYYRQGVAAGERALGPEYFMDRAGHFWGLLETRPYMRARLGLAGTFWRLRKLQEAEEHYRELLRLNPGDNQGVRYLLLALLLQMGRDAQAKELIGEYRGEPTAHWAFTQALLEFRKNGASPAANKLLQKAMNRNRFVAAYLIGQERVPEELPDHIGFGDETEAVSYAADFLNSWRRTPGATEWGAEWAKVKGKQRRPADDQAPSSGPARPARK